MNRLPPELHQQTIEVYIRGRDDFMSNILIQKLGLNLDFDTFLKHYEADFVMSVLVFTGKITVNGGNYYIHGPYKAELHFLVNNKAFMFYKEGVFDFNHQVGFSTFKLYNSEERIIYMGYDWIQSNKSFTMIDFISLPRTLHISIKTRNDNEVSITSYYIDKIVNINSLYFFYPELHDANSWNQIENFIINILPNDTEFVLSEKNIIYANYIPINKLDYYLSLMEFEPSKRDNIYRMHNSWFLIKHKPAIKSSGHKATDVEHWISAGYEPFARGDTFTEMYININGDWINTRNDFNANRFVAPTVEELVNILESHPSTI